MGVDPDLRPRVLGESLDVTSSARVRRGGDLASRRSAYRRAYACSCIPYHRLVVLPLAPAKSPCAERRRRRRTQVFAVRNAADWAGAQQHKQLASKVIIRGYDDIWFFLEAKWCDGQQARLTEWSALAELLLCSLFEFSWEWTSWQGVRMNQSTRYQDMAPSSFATSLPIFYFRWPKLSNYLAREEITRSQKIFSPP